MIPPPLPPDEPERLSALRALGLLDTPAEERFDRITRLAQAVFDVPIALVSLVDADRQWFKSKQGIEASETPRSLSFCGHAILGSELFEIRDTKQDERFRDNPLVLGEPIVRFYAGSPISAPNGKKIGTLCLIDRRPRELTPAQRQALADLAALVEDEIRSSRRDRKLAEQAARERELAPAAAASKTSAKVIGGFVLAAVTVLALAGLFYRDALSFINTARWVQHTHQVIERVERVLSLAKDEESGARGFVLTGDEVYLKHQAEARSQMGGLLAGLRQLVSDNPEQMRRLERVARAANAREEKDAWAASRRRSGGLAAGVQAVRRVHDQGTMDELRAAIADMNAEERRLLDARTARAADDAQNLKTVLATGSAAAALILLLALAAVLRDFDARAKAEFELVLARDALVRDADERRLAQAETERLSDRLQAVLDRMDAGVIMVEHDGRISVFNASAERIHGGWRAEIEALVRAGTHPPTRIDGNPLPPEEDPLACALRGETTRDVELYFRTPFRPRGYYLSVSSAPVRTQQGAPSGAVLVFREITEIVRARRRQELQYDAAWILAGARPTEDPIPLILQSLCQRMRWTVAGFWAPDADGGTQKLVELWSQPGARIDAFLLASEAAAFAPGHGLPGRVWKERRPVWLPDVTTAQNFPRASAAAESGLRSAFAFPVMAGERCLGVIEVLTSRLHEPDEDLLKLVSALGSQVGMFLDRRATAAAAAASSAQLQAIFDAAADVAIISTDPHGLITVFNRGAEHLLGYSAAEMVGRQTPAILHVPSEIEKRAAEISVQLGREVRGFAVFTTPLEGGASESREWTYVRKDGTRFPAQLITTAVRGAGGVTTGYLGVATDISARKRIEEELGRARDLAVEAAQAKARFLANMSHEIRTPMNAIIGMTGLLLDTPLDKRQQDYLKTVRDAGDALLTLLNDILDYSKIEAGKMTLETLDFDLREVIERSVELVAQRAQEKGLELAASMPPSVPSRLRGDPSRLRQVLLNLLGNAVKFTQKGEVCVRVTSREEAGRAVVQVEIRDTGIGIPAEALGRLFQSFTQADTTTTRRYGGSGLGLAISRQLVELMGGRIAAASEPGRGSTFRFEIPFEPGADAPSEGPQGLPDLAVVRALIVDDNETNREILRAQLAAWRMEGDAAASAAEALRSLANAAAAGRPYGVAILDLQMPDVDGLALAASIKADRRIPDLPLILMTSLGDVLPPAAAAATGLSACLRKPVRQSTLYDSLASVLSSRAPAAGAAPAAAAAPVLERRLRVLIVEDNTVNQKVIMLQLQKLGHAADVVSGGREALEWIDRIAYDVVLMDCQMPGMDGYETTVELRRREAAQGRRRVPVVALTANVMPEDRQKCFAAGMDDYLSKPVRVDDLARVVAARANVPLHMPTVLEIKDLAGDEGFARIRGEFLAGARRMIDEMKSAADAEDAETLKRAAHSLKGSSGSLGAKGLEALCSELELRLNDSGAPGRWRALVARMEDEFVAAKRAFEAA